MTCLSGLGAAQPDTAFPPPGEGFCRPCPVCQEARSSWNNPGACPRRCGLEVVFSDDFRVIRHKAFPRSSVLHHSRLCAVFQGAVLLLLNAGVQTYLGWARRRCAVSSVHAHGRLHHTGTVRPIEKSHHSRIVRRDRFMLCLPLIALISANAIGRRGR